VADSLLQAAARGDHGAFDLAVTQLSGPIHHLVRTLVRDRAQAEEVTQEVLFEMWRQVTRYDRAKAAQQHGHSRSPAPRHRPGPLHGSKLRPRARNAVAAVSWDQVSEALDQTLDREQLHHCVDALSSLQLQAIVLAFYGGHTYPEIAITYSAAASGQLDIAVSNILGGIALQTVVLVALDAFGVRERRPLTYQAAASAWSSRGPWSSPCSSWSSWGHNCPRAWYGPGCHQMWSRSRSSGSPGWP
jgi:RNA polymerase sigma-70 factor (ECF subfamily)